jgi:hypothetical protein
MTFFSVKVCFNSAVSIGMEPWELIRSLCSVPSVKFMNANFVCRRLELYYSIGRLLHTYVFLCTAEFLYD